eukprot:GHVT01093840.1.p1 GENE.GHVT01093840.1~~GHVT01093840.1.p1  ORF type:complete len:178 (+),score=25.40 GHVT01093840.1:69-602(+)
MSVMPMHPMGEQSPAVSANKSRQFAEMQKYLQEQFVPVLQSRQVVCRSNEILEIQSPEHLAGKITFKPRADAVFQVSSKQICLLVDLPGFNKTDIEIEIDKCFLFVSGERSNEELTDRYGGESTIHLRERPFGFFCRCFQLPPNAIEDTIQASLTEGQLEIRVDCLPSGDKKKVDVA